MLVPGMALLSCSTGDEQKISQALTAMQSAVEGRQPRVFIGHLAEGFEDQQGRNARAVRSYLAGLFLRNASVNVFITDLDIRLAGDTATSRCLVTVTGGQGIIPERMRRIILLLEWKKLSGDWKVYRANWHEPE